MDEGVSMFWGRCNFKAEDGMNCLERTNSLEMSLPEDWAAGGLSQSTEPPEEPESCAPEPAPGLQTQKVQGGFWTQASGESRPGDPTGHPPMPAPVSTRGLQRLYKYTLFGFSRKGGGGLPPESKQNGFSQIAKPSEGQRGRTRATDPETRCPSLQRHGLHRALFNLPLVPMLLFSIIFLVFLTNDCILVCYKMLCSFIHRSKKGFTRG